MHIKEIIAFLNDVAPPQFQEDYDNAGLITGHTDMDISGVLICLDATESVIEEAISLGCNLVIAHHPILFRGIKKLNGKNYVERSIIKAIKNDIAIFAIHTNLDNVFVSGVNSKIADKLQLTKTEILQPRPEVLHKGQAIGAGILGTLSSPQPSLQFLHHLKDKMELSMIKHTRLCKETIQTVAVCGGAGGFLLETAKKRGADILITSDYKYHEFFDADNAIIIADIGHFESEKYTIELLHGIIVNKFSTFVAHCTKIITNPVHYL